uniref:Uncharacterized protein n=1 Tax=Bracon brevicornis TaxID=1563983 RepID=A0A6V7JGG8_9HYME
MTFHSFVRKHITNSTTSPTTKVHSNYNRSGRANASIHDPINQHAQFHPGARVNNAPRNETASRDTRSPHHPSRSRRVAAGRTPMGDEYFALSPSSPKRNKWMVEPQPEGRQHQGKTKKKKETNNIMYSIIMYGFGQIGNA